MGRTWKDPGKATDYDLTAPLNKGSFAHAYTFQSVIAEARFDGNQLAEVKLHPVEMGYGDKLTTSGVPRVVSDEATAREILQQVSDQTAKFGLPALDIRFSDVTGVIVPAQSR